MTHTSTEQEFESWWQENGQFCRAGGGDYEKTFAYRAWQASRRAPVVPQRCDLCKNNGGYFYGRTGYEPCCVGSLAPQPPEADHIPDAGKMVAAPMQIPENIREGEPYDNPAFEALARALGVWGTAQSAVCAQFWIAAKEQST